MVTTEYYILCIRQYEYAFTDNFKATVARRYMDALLQLVGIGANQMPLCG